MYKPFGGIRRSSFTSFWWQMEPFRSLWWLLLAFPRLLWQMESFASLWWLAWIAVQKPLVADGVIYKPLVAYGDRRSQALGGRWSHLQAFSGIRGSSCTRLLLTCVDRRVEAFGGIRGLSFTSLSWLTWIAVCKPLVADGVNNKPLVAYVDRPLQAFGGRWSHLQAFGGRHGSSCTRLLMAFMDRRVAVFGGVRGSPFTSLWWQIKSFTSFWGQTWIIVYKPLVAYVDYHV